MKSTKKNGINESTPLLFQENESRKQQREELLRRLNLPLMAGLFAIQSEIPTAPSSSPSTTAYGTCHLNR